MRKLLSCLGLLVVSFLFQAEAGVILSTTGFAPVDDEQTYTVMHYKVSPLENGHGEVHHLWVNTDSPLSTQFEMVAVTLNQYQSTLYLQPSLRQALPLEKLAWQQRALLAINGGYFTQDFQPDGFMLLNGKALSPYSTDPLVSAWVGINASGQIVILPNTGEDSYGDLSTAMETGPLLINEGKMLSIGICHLNPFAMRTVLAESDSGQLIVISSSAISLYTLENILYQHPQWFGVRKIMTAANLDGGKSTALVLNDPKLKITVPEQQPLKIVLLFQ